MKKAIGGVLLLAVIAVMAAGCEYDDGTTKSSSGRSCYDPGATFRVNADAGYFASTDHDYKEAINAAASGDKEGFVLLAAEGVIFPLEAGTRLRVTDTGFSSIQFRVLSGDSHLYETVRGECSWVH
jgi:hypothetical protein